jgi:dihydrofolate reductase
MNPLPSLRAIVAISRNGVIGVDGHLPWHLPEDLHLFRQLTIGHTLIMGRKTYQSIGKPLPGRRNWVLSRQLQGAAGENLRFFQKLEELLRAVRKARAGEEFWVIGGGEIYRQLVPFCGEIVCTRVHRDCGNEGSLCWAIPEKFQRGECIYDCPQFTTHRWRRI